MRIIHSFIYYSLSLTRGDYSQRRLERRGSQEPQSIGVRASESKASRQVEYLVHMSQ